MAESNRSAHYTEPLPRRQAAALLRTMRAQIAVCDNATHADCRKILNDLQIPLVSKLRVKDALVDCVEQELMLQAVLRHRHSVTHEKDKAL